jgi:hypothetical protein
MAKRRFGRVRKRPRTLTLYSGLVRNHINPTLGDKPLRTLTAAMLRAWRQSLLDGGLGPVTTAKAYRLLRSIGSTAVEDRHPCHIKGAAAERSPERPVLTVQEVYRIADGMHRRFRALILVGALGQPALGQPAMGRVGRVRSCVGQRSSGTGDVESLPQG